MAASRSLLILFVALLCAGFMGCGVYSFTGASVEGKTINFHTLENRARNVVPSLSASLTQKIRNRIVSQTGLAPVNTDSADYDVNGFISGYDVSVTGVANTQQSTQNRLTISISMEFKNRLNPKANFTQTFSRFADFPATQTLQAVENRLIDQIGNELADDVFNKAFVNW